MKKSYIVLGSIISVLLITSTATAVSYSNTRTINENNQEGDKTKNLFTSIREKIKNIKILDSLKNDLPKLDLDQNLSHQLDVTDIPQKIKSSFNDVKTEANGFIFTLFIMMAAGAGAGLITTSLVNISPLLTAISAFIYCIFYYSELLQNPELSLLLLPTLTSFSMIIYTCARIPQLWILFCTLYCIILTFNMW